MNAIIENAVAAQKKWREVPVQQRVRVLIKFHTLLVANKDAIADIIVRENGKTKVDAIGDVTRGIEVVEHALAMPTLMMGDSIEQITNNMDTKSIRQPLGVVAGIAPFNFPAMIPLWMIPLAIGTGNALVLKPSEKVPGAAQMIVKLASDAGVPAGVLNVMHGGKEAVATLCSHPAIKAVSFVGSGHVGQIVYKAATANGKRAQCNMGAKNHAVVMPDAQKEQALNGIIGAAFGAAGQRCMAVSVVVLVGSAAAFLPDLIAKATALRVGAGGEASTDVGPVISVEAKTRILSLVAASIHKGAKVELDGRDVVVSGYEQGNFLGPTVLSNVTPDMPCYAEELFGPVLCVMEAGTLEDAIAIVNSNPMGNGVALFTSSGGAARKFEHDIEVGQVGINVPVPVPLPFFSWTSSKGSLLGDHHFYGKSAVEFYTQSKTVVSRWEFVPTETDAGSVNFSGR